MSNLIKYNSFVMGNQDRLVIDSNKMADEIIEQHRRLVKENNGERIPDEDGFVCGLDAATVEQLVEDCPSTEQDSRNESVDIDKLRRQEEEIINQARTEAELIKSKARDAGYEQGLADAREDTQARIEAARKELEEQYSHRVKKLEEEYARKKSELEPQLVETLLQVFAKVTGTIAEGKKDMVLFLINNVLSNTESSKEYLIKVSEEDYSYLSSNRQLLHEGISKDVKIDICTDGALKRNQCIIETDAGVFDCSLDIQLENLINDIRLLSCLDD